MVCVDTSVWITAFRERQSAQAKHLAGLLDNDEVGLTMPVKIELLRGASHTDRQLPLWSLHADFKQRPS
ncbi:MAG: PIN domain-containing protein [Acidobacteriota bacterium]|nr:PIN domain-containing protein [Acidobacteriota bacterium]